MTAGRAAIIMKLSAQKISVVIVLVLVVLAWLAYRKPNKTEPVHLKSASSALQTSNQPEVAIPQTNLLRLNQRIGRLRASEFTAEQKVEFAVEFEEKIKPALDKWCETYAGHLPFSPADVTPERFVERLGRNLAFYEYTFVIDGTTLCFKDLKGSVIVSYLNSPESKKLMELPGGAPVSEIPLNRNEVAQILKLDSGTEFKADEIRMIPT